MYDSFSSIGLCGFFRGYSELRSPAILILRLTKLPLTYVFPTDCAEFINTLTNLIFIGLAIKGMRNVLKEGHDTIFFVAFAGYCCVGIGSFLFHATLWYSMQLVDELSMIYATSIMMWGMYLLCPAFAPHPASASSVSSGFGISPLLCVALQNRAL